jgi:hypothetical protein
MRWRLPEGLMAWFQAGCRQALFSRSFFRGNILVVWKKTSLEKSLDAASAKCT